MNFHKNTSYIYDVIIIGAGPSGLFAASSLSTTVKKILILEKNSSAGKKLLLSGNGQCNLTHTGEIESFFSKYGSKSNFIKPSILNFSNKDLVKFLEGKGLPLYEREDGKIFPKSLKSSDLLELLLSLCASENIIIKYNEPVVDVDYINQEFMISAKETYKSKILIISSGGKSYPNTGSAGDGFLFAQKLGHTIIQPKPALVPIKIKNYPFADLSGISISNVLIKLSRHDKIIEKNSGDILFTHRNISGPVVLNISRYAMKNDIINIDFTRDSGISSLDDYLIQESSVNGKRSIKSVLKKISVPSRLIDILLNFSEVNSETKCSELSKESRRKIIVSFTSFKMEVEDTEGFEIAMVTAGGISTQEINRKTMESKIVHGLYFIGEVIDIDGDSGGYNIQAAFSTGKLAADSIKKL
jgi:hypothetical protein